MRQAKPLMQLHGGLQGLIFCTFLLRLCLVGAVAVGVTKESFATRAGVGRGGAVARRRGMEALSAKARAHRRDLGILEMYDAVFEAPQCDCACCIVERRRPSEAGGETQPKCGAPPLSQRQEQCRGQRCTAVGDLVLTNADVIDLERFCFYRCRPEGGLMPREKAVLLNQPDASFHGGYFVDTPCVPVPPDLLSQADVEDGNGRDPHLPAEVPPPPSQQQESGFAL
mmetsp:Transcript_121289/g.258889  ORF Transcript_121289/g.258889 Transcript_121289/m.258889 type:complete len:226 (+) Transcript_121289:77-754(+)